LRRNLQKCNTISNDLASSPQQAVTQGEVSHIFARNVFGSCVKS